MSKKFHLKTLVLALGLLFVSGMAQAEFSNKMNAQQVVEEINTQLKAGTSLEDIAKAAKGVGLNPAKVTEFLIKAGQPAAAVVTAVVSVTPTAAKAVTSMAVSISPASQAAEIAAAAVAQAPALAKEITAVAIEKAPAQAKQIANAVLAVPGVDPTQITQVTGLGSEKEGKESDKKDSDKKDQEQAKPVTPAIVPLYLPPSTPPASGGGSASPAGIP